jgi:hypothetical protein
VTATNFDVEIIASSVVLTTLLIADAPLSSSNLIEESSVKFVTPLWDDGVLMGI